MALRPLTAAALAALLGAVLFAAGSATPATPAAEAKARWCATWTLPSASIQVRVRILRRTTCRRAKTVARRYDRFVSTPPWNCALARAGDLYRGRQVLYSCGAGAPSSGDLRSRRYAFLLVRA